MTTRRCRGCNALRWCARSSNRSNIAAGSKPELHQASSAGRSFARSAFSFVFAGFCLRAFLWQHASLPMTATPDLTIIIPALNEQENLRLLLPQIQDVLHDLAIRSEVIVVD